MEHNERELLHERLKELSCLYDIAKITLNSSKIFDEIIGEIVQRIPEAWQFEADAVCHIQIRTVWYKSAEAPEENVSQEQLIRIEEQRIGRLRVFYPAPKYTEADFLEEEYRLLEKLALDLSLFIERQEIKSRELRYQESLRHHDRLKVLGEITAGIAHELNTPLGSILGFSQLIMDDSKDLATLADAEKIMHAAIHAREVVKKLMYFSCELPQRLECISFNELIQDTIVLIKPQLESRQIQLETHFSESPVSLQLDTVQITQVIFNLITNALYASGENGKILIETCDKGENAELIVQDFGRGMPEETVAQIFEPFFTTKEVGEGMGLGLSVVHGIVKSHKGSIFVKSKMGKGTMFRIVLPKKQVS
ncbi:ATP-binding protein [Fluviicola sp.]|uniref:sensor histidine kinase n=1 Tax=Fluviicola sp. TaxID=1917219 RepID=UPI0028275EC0|nr:ATP-binding protein [Fluviicola sp.]MDR0801693.1 sensor histidine kinase [Fluviicola sp.]